MCKRIYRVVFVALLALVGSLLSAADGPMAEPKWSANLTNVEACSCPAFCQCYFTGSPAMHADHANAMAMQYCRFNNAFKINKGEWGDEKLDGLKFWMSGDLGGDFSKPPLWVVLTFEPSATATQRVAVRAIVGHIFMVDANKAGLGPDASIDWQLTPDIAVAKLADGKSAEISLKKSPGMSDDPVMIKNLKFWAAPRNEGVIVMPAVVEAYRLGDHAFEYKDSNGFVVTLDMNSDDFRK